VRQKVDSFKVKGCFFHCPGRPSMTGVFDTHGIFNNTLERPKHTRKLQVSLTPLTTAMLTEGNIHPVACPDANGMRVKLSKRGLEANANAPRRSSCGYAYLPVITDCTQRTPSTMPSLQCSSSSSLQRMIARAEDFRLFDRIIKRDLDKKSTSCYERLLDNHRRMGIVNN
jgi:hypothetical protein